MERFLNETGDAALEESIAPLRAMRQLFNSFHEQLINFQVEHDLPQTAPAGSPMLPVISAVDEYKDYFASTITDLAQDIQYALENPDEELFQTPGHFVREPDNTPTYL